MNRGFKASRIPESGLVASYDVTFIERDEKVMLHGTKAFLATDTGAENDMGFADLLATENTVLYTYDLAQNIMVFLTVPDKAALWRAHPLVFTAGLPFEDILLGAVLGSLPLGVLAGKCFLVRNIWNSSFPET